MSDEPAPSEGAHDQAIRRGDAFRGRRVAYNSVAMIGGQIAITLIGLVTTPVTLSHVGLVEFGLFVTITTSIAYITIIDPGFGDMVTRYGARAHIEGDRTLGARLCSLFSLFWIGIGLLGLPLFVWLMPLYVHHINLSPGLRGVAIEFFYWAYAYLVFGSVASILTARLTAIGDQWLVTVIDTATRVAYGVLVLVLLFDGFKLKALIVASSAQLVLQIGATLYFVVRRAGAPFGNPMRLDRHLIKEVSRFGGWLQLGGVLEALTYDTDPLIIATFVSVARVGTYSIGQRVARQSTYFAYIAQSSILSAISAAYAANEGLVAMRRMYTRANRIVVLTGGVIGGAVLGMAPVIIAAWFGRSYQYGDAVSCLAAAGLMLGLPRPVAAAVIMAMGRVGLGVRAQVLAFLVNLALTLALVGPLGMFGVLWGTVIGKLVATTYLLVRFHRMVDGSARELLYAWLTKLLVAIAAGAGVARLIIYELPRSTVNERLPALAALCGLGAAYLVVVAIVLRATQYFGTEDLAWFGDILPARLSRVVRSRTVHWVLGAP